MAMPTTHKVVGFFYYLEETMGILLFDKPFKTYEEQLDILEQKYGLIIGDRKQALTALQSLTYYDLVNGYKECFMKNEKFESGISLEFLHLFCQIDKHIQSIIFKYTTIVENSYKSKLAYVISDNFGVWECDYLDSQNYFKSNNKISFYKIQNACLKIFDGSKPIPQPTKHYLEKHNHIPPWILFKNLSFSNAINLFQLLKPNEKQALANLIIPDKNLSYSQKVEFIIAALNLIRTFRNKIAHNLKFITYKNDFHKLDPKTILKLSPSGLLHWKDIKKHNRGLNDIYSDILCILVLLNDKQLIGPFLFELLLAFHKINTINTPNMNLIKQKYYVITNIPPDIEKRISSLKSIK